MEPQLSYMDWDILPIVPDASTNTISLPELRK